MNTSDKGLDFIRSFEGYLTKQPDGSCKAYQCQAGVWTCGWGSTVGVGPNTHWTVDEAKAAFAREMEKHAEAVNRIVKVSIGQASFDSLVSFSYNCGEGALAKLCKPLNAGDWRGTATKFSEFVKYRDPTTREMKVSRGLVRRRSDEASMFVTGMTEDVEQLPMPQRVAPPAPKIEARDALWKIGGGSIVTVEGARAVVDQGKEIKSIAVDARGLVPPVSLPAVGAGMIVAAVVVLVVVLKRA